MILLRAFENLLPHEEPLEPFYISFPPENRYMDGYYPLVDLYCQEAECHCHKVSFLILNQKHKILATIAYGWKSKSWYHKWGLDKEGTQWLINGFLDPWGYQSPYAPLLLKPFLWRIKSNPKFLQTIKKRYALFKNEIYNPDYRPLNPREMTWREPANTP